MVEERRDGVVHQWVGFDEVQVGVVELLAVVWTRSCNDWKYDWRQHLT